MAIRCGGAREALFPPGRGRGPPAARPPARTEGHGAPGPPAAGPGLHVGSASAAGLAPGPVRARRRTRGPPGGPRAARPLGRYRTPIVLGDFSSGVTRATSSSGNQSSPESSLECLRMGLDLEGLSAAGSALPLLQRALQVFCCALNLSAHLFAHLRKARSLGLVVTGHVSMHARSSTPLLVVQSLSHSDSTSSCAAAGRASSHAPSRQIPTRFIGRIRLLGDATRSGRRGGGGLRFLWGRGPLPLALPLPPPQQAPPRSFLRALPSRGGSRAGGEGGGGRASVWAGRGPSPGGPASPRD